MAPTDNEVFMEAVRALADGIVRGDEGLLNLSKELVARVIQLDERIKLLMERVKMLEDTLARRID